MSDIVTYLVLLRPKVLESVELCMPCEEAIGYIQDLLNHPHEAL